MNEDSADLRVFWWVIDFGVFRNCYHWRFLCERGFGFCMFCLVREREKKKKKKRYFGLDIVVGSVPDTLAKI